MEQKQVKILGLTLNKKLGILEATTLKFNKDNNLIAIKGTSGSGKTTLQKSLRLGTQGSDVLKNDKQLYGVIDTEVQLLDGNIPVFIGCKTNKSGSLDYVIYTKEDGKINRKPVLDGVKLTPATYLKELQTALTWRVDELTSENPTVQKALLLDMYKKELANLGVIFDKKDEDYSKSILGKIDLAINERTRLDFERKTVGGFLNQLENIGISPIKDPSSIPTYVDIADLEKQKNKLQYQIDNVADAKDQKLLTVKNEASSIILLIKEENSRLKKLNEQINKDFEEKKEEIEKNKFVLQNIVKDLEDLHRHKCFSKEDYKRILNDINLSFKIDDIQAQPYHKLAEFNDKGQPISKFTEFDNQPQMKAILFELKQKREKYIKINNEPVGSTEQDEKELELVMQNLTLAKENNKTVDMVNSFLAWHEAELKVQQLRNEYANLLQSIDTGVEGLFISVNKEESGKLEIYLTYNGIYDTKYFNNPNLENRKLSSYSGTQKPMIALLLQNYLLSRKPKAMRYLWIDEVPIDNKTKNLLNRMGEQLGVTIIVNITGDFDKESLQNGEVLIEGGQLFFN